MTKTQPHLLDCSAQIALSKGYINGMVVCCYENERPLLGLAGKLDWSLNGAISYYLKKRTVTGKTNECVYLPIQKLSYTHHFFLLGCGNNNTPGLRQLPQQSTIDKLTENINNLGLLRIGVSLSDFGQKAPEQIRLSLKEAQLWIVH